LAARIFYQRNASAIVCGVDNLWFVYREQLYHLRANFKDFRSKTRNVIRR